MDFAIIWFILIAVLFTGYFFLEGFDFGVGILAPFLSKDEIDRRVYTNTIGPFWDANEVWLITAGGAMFAAFPHWYATLFSGFYIALFFILLALIVRAVGFEFRSKAPQSWWRKTCDAFVFWGSALPALLWGVAITNLVRGVPIGADMDMEGGFLALLHPYALLGGIVSLSVFCLHGALFLSLRTEGELRDRALRAAKILWTPVAAILLLFVIWGQWEAVIFEGMGVVPNTLALIPILSYCAALPLILKGMSGWAFSMVGTTIIFGTVVAFHGLFPMVMPSSLNLDWSLTVHNASSSDLTLRVMFFVALLFVPIVLAYQGWSYWVFRQRITREAISRAS